MGLQLPGELISLLGMLGFSWPEADETKLMEMGGKWISFGGTLQSTSANADQVAQGVWTSNKGEDFEAFQRTGRTTRPRPRTSAAPEPTACSSAPGSSSRALWCWP